MCCSIVIPQILQTCHLWERHINKHKWWQLWWHSPTVSQSVSNSHSVVPTGLLIRSYITLNMPGNIPTSSTIFDTSSKDKSLLGTAGTTFMKSCGTLSSLQLMKSLMTTGRDPLHLGAGEDKPAKWPQSKTTKIPVKCTVINTTGVWLTELFFPALARTC